MSRAPPGPGKDPSGLRGPRGGFCMASVTSAPDNAAPASAGPQRTPLTGARATRAQSSSRDTNNNQVKVLTVDLLSQLIQTKQRGYVKHPPVTFMLPIPSPWPVPNATKITSTGTRSFIAARSATQHAGILSIKGVVLSQSNLNRPAQFIQVRLQFSTAS